MAPPRICSNENCPTVRGTDTIQCHGCKSSFHMKCYGLSRAQILPWMENGNFKFLCDRCTVAIGISANVNVGISALTKDVKELSTELRDLKSTVGDVKDVLHNVNFSLPPSMMFQEMHETLNIVKSTGEKTATVVNEIRSSCDPLSNASKTSDLLKTLVNIMAPAAANNTKIIELLTDIRSATIVSPSLSQQQQLSRSIANNKRARSPHPFDGPEFGQRNKRPPAILGTGPDTSDFVVGRHSSTSNTMNSLVISPLHPRTSTNQIKSFITSKLGIDVE